MPWRDILNSKTVTMNFFESDWRTESASIGIERINWIFSAFHARKLKSITQVGLLACSGFQLLPNRQLPVSGTFVKNTDSLLNRNLQLRGQLLI